jgi:HEAT repeat protein
MRFLRLRSPLALFICAALVLGGCQDRRGAKEGKADKEAASTARADAAKKGGEKSTPSRKTEPTARTETPKKDREPPRKPTPLEKTADEEPSYRGKTLAAWIAQLKAKDAGDRLHAVHGVVFCPPRLATRKLVALLLPLLKDEDEYIRQAVAFRLGTLSNEAGEALPALLEASKVNDSGGKAARAALQSFRTAPRSMAPALVKLLKDPEPHVRLKAAQVLCELEEADKECLAALLALVKRRDSQTRRDAVQLLCRYGSAAREAVPALLEIVRTDVNPQTRCLAIGALKTIGADAKSTVPVLRDVVRNEGDLATRRSAIWVLGSFGPDAKPALPTLKAVLAKVQEKTPGRPGYDGRGRRIYGPAPEQQLAEALKAALKKIEE